MTRAPYMVPSSRRPITRSGEPVQPMAMIHPCYVEGCEASAPFGYRVPNQPLGLFACRDHLNGLERFVRDDGAPTEVPHEQSDADNSLFAGDDRRP